MTAALLVAAALLSPTAAIEDAFSTMSTEKVQKFLAVRGVACDGCDARGYQAKARESANVPIDPELQDIVEEESKYALKVKEFHMTRDIFVAQLNDTDKGISPGRAERAWRHFQAQLESGSLHFLGNGTVRFSMPLTHTFGDYLPAVVCDAIESAYSAARGWYLTLPRKNRRRLEMRFDAAFESGAIHGLLVLLLVALVFDVLFAGSSDDSTPAPAASSTADKVKPTRTSRTAKAKGE